MLYSLPLGPLPTIDQTRPPESYQETGDIHTAGKDIIKNIRRGGVGVGPKGEETEETEDTEGEREREKRIRETSSCVFMGISRCMFHRKHETLLPRQMLELSSYTFAAIVY